MQSWWLDLFFANSTILFSKLTHELRFCYSLFPNTTGLDYRNLICAGTETGIVWKIGQLHKAKGLRAPKTSASVSMFRTSTHGKDKSPLLLDDSVVESVAEQRYDNTSTNDLPAGAAQRYDVSTDLTIDSCNNAKPIVKVVACQVSQLNNISRNLENHIVKVIA